MKKMKTVALVLMSLLLAGGTWSCEKNDEYDNLEVVENSFSGNVNPTSIDADPAGDFTGNGDSGTYSFAWKNPGNLASITFDVTASSGNVQLIVEDAEGNEVLNKTRPSGDLDSYSGPTQVGEPGTWIITIVFSNFDGDGSYSIHPGE